MRLFIGCLSLSIERDFSFRLCFFNPFFTLTVFIAVDFLQRACLRAFVFVPKKKRSALFFTPGTQCICFYRKAVTGYIHAGWMVYLGFLTLLAAIQHYFNTGFLIYITGSIGFFFFLVIPVCIAAITILCISRVTPFIRARGILTVIGILVSSVLVLLSG